MRSSTFLLEIRLFPFRMLRYFRRVDAQVPTATASLAWPEIKRPCSMIRQMRQQDWRKCSMKADRQPPALLETPATPPERFERRAALTEIPRGLRSKNACGATPTSRSAASTASTFLHSARPVSRRATPLSQSVPKSIPDRPQRHTNCAGRINRCSDATSKADRPQPSMNV